MNVIKINLFINQNYFEYIEHIHLIIIILFSIYDIICTHYMHTFLINRLLYNASDDASVK